ncbi:MAG: hypothetical protein L6Q76_25670 [Polyangiaceae bacterium]|nr:hypothetical protein [Polyangiaceae bacterium]
MSRRVVWRAWGQPDGGPIGVLLQSSARMRAPISPPLGNGSGAALGAAGAKDFES